MASLYDQIPVPELLGDGESALDEYLEPERDVPTRSRRHTIKEFCQSVLHSREYRESVLRRIDSDTLPAQIESMFYHFAYGKPVERVEHTGRDGAPIETVTEVRRVVVRVNVDHENLEKPPPMRNVLGKDSGTRH